MEDGDAERTLLRARETRRRPLELRGGDGTALVAERLRRVEPDDVEPRHGGDGLGRLPYALELRPRPHEARRRVGDVVVPGYREHRRTERPEERRRRLELLAAAAVREIARRDDELRIEFLDDLREPAGNVRLVVRAHVQVGNMENTCSHDRTRL
jgi:hypothetical protein